jgi:hypothetical protein
MNKTHQTLCFKEEEYMPVSEPQRGLTFDDVWVALTELRESQRETDWQMKETDQQLKQMFKETDRRMQETDRKIGKLGSRIGDLN